MNGAEIILNVDDLKTERQPLDQELERCCEFACSEKLYINQTTETTTETNKKPYYIITDVVSEANQDMASGLFSNLCPTNQQWFRFELTNKPFQSNEDTENYLTRVSQILYTILMNSNFSMECNEAFEDVGWAGIMNLYLEKDYERGFTFRNINISEYWIDEDAKGKIDTVYREFRMTARQMVQVFGKEKLPEAIRKDVESGEMARMNRKRYVIHAVYLNPKIEYDDTGSPIPSNTNKMYNSEYVIREFKQTVKKSGYDFMPYNVARFQKKAKAKYGFSPCRRILRTAQTVNKMKVLLTKYFEKAVDPPKDLDVRAYRKAGLVPTYFSNPNSINLYDGSTGNPPQGERLTNSIGEAYNIYQEDVQSIQKAYFTDMFLMIQNMNNQQGRERTAYEIQQLVAEKQSMIIPVVSRILEELFTPMLEKCFYIADEMGLLPPKPEGLDGAIKISFISPLALSTRMSTVRNFTDALQTVSPMAQFDPNIFDYVNTDNAVPEIFNLCGVSPDFVRTRQEVEQIRQTRAEQQKEAETQEQMTEVAKGQNLTEKPQEGSPLAGAMANLTGG